MHVLAPVCGHGQPRSPRQRAARHRRHVQRLALVQSVLEGADGQHLGGQEQAVRVGAPPAELSTQQRHAALHLAQLAQGGAHDDVPLASVCRRAPGSAAQAAVPVPRIASGAPCTAACGVPQHAELRDEHALRARGRPHLRPPPAA